MSKGQSVRALEKRVSLLESALKREQYLRRIFAWCVARYTDPSTAFTNITTECEAILGLSHNGAPSTLYKFFTCMNGAAELGIPDSSAPTLESLKRWALFAQP